MILTGPEIQHQVRKGKISIFPFNPSFVNPNSYDFTLGDKLLIYKKKILDTKTTNPTRIVRLDQSGYLLSPERIYLAHTREVFSTNYFVPIFFARSSVGRLGLFIHATANLIDIGHRGQWTLQLHAVQPIRIYPGMRIGQVTFWRPLGSIKLYEGKYQDSAGPVASKSTFKRGTNV